MRAQKRERVGIREGDDLVNASRFIRVFWDICTYIFGMLVGAAKTRDDAFSAFEQPTTKTGEFIVCTHDSGIG